jgi:hypothetical protein
LKRSYLNIAIFDVLCCSLRQKHVVTLIELKIPLRNLLDKPIEMVRIMYLVEFLQPGIYIVAYLLHARTVEPQKQPLLSNTRTQQYNKGVMQSVSRQRLGKHVPTRTNIGSCVFCVDCATQQYNDVFSVRWSVLRRYNATPLVANSVKRMGIKRHTAAQLSVGGSHGKFVVEEELVVGL